MYIGINLQKSEEANIEDNNIQLYGNGIDDGPNLIGIQIDHWSAEDTSELREIYSANKINGSINCYRFWCTQG
jgi:hypothetical protein